MANGNPLIAQGTLNRLRASVNITNFPQLNVTASYLGKAGVSLTLEGESTTYIPTMVGAVTSPEPYMMVSCTINLLRTQGLAALYKAQMEDDSRVGDFIITPDAITLPTYTIVNGAIESIKEMPMNGEDAGYVVTMKGYYIVNNALWSA